MAWKASSSYLATTRKYHSKPGRSLLNNFKISHPSCAVLTEQVKFKNNIVHKTWFAHAGHRSLSSLKTSETYAGEKDGAFTAASDSTNILPLSFHYNYRCAWRSAVRATSHNKVVEVDNADKNSDTLIFLLGCCEVTHMLHQWCTTMTHYMV